MLSDSAKTKVLSALQPLYADPDFANVVGDFNVTIETVAVVQTPPPNDSEVVDVVRA